MTTMTPQFNQLLEAEQKMIFFKEHDQVELLFPYLFERKPLTKAYEDGIRIGALGTFAVKAEGTPIPFDDPIQGTQKRVVAVTYALGWRRTMEMIQDDQFGIMNKMAADLGDSSRDHMDRIAWDLINDAYTGARHTVLEGETLFSTTHSLIKSGGTQSNMQSPSVPLSVTGIEAMLTQAKTSLSMEGRYAQRDQSILLHNPAEAHNAYTLLNTEYRPGTANNDKSTVVSSRTGLTPLSVPYLTSTTAWSIHARPGKNGLVWYDRMKLDLSSAPDADTKDQKSYAVYRAVVAGWEWENNFGSGA